MSDDNHENDVPDSEETTETIELSNAEPEAGFIHIGVTADGNLQLDAQNVGAANLWAASKMLDFHANQMYAQYLAGLQQKQIELARGNLQSLGLLQDHKPRQRN
jgi:hypothetical protein